MDSRAGGGSGLIVKDDVTNTRPLTPPDTKQRFKRVKSEGGRQNGNSDTGLQGRGAGVHEWRVCLCVCVFIVQLKEMHTLSKIYTVMHRNKSELLNRCRVLMPFDKGSV